MYKKLTLSMLLPFLFTFLSASQVHAQLQAGTWYTQYDPNPAIVFDSDQPFPQNRQVSWYQFRSNVWGDDKYVNPKSDGVGFQNMWVSWGYNLQWLAWGLHAEHTNGQDGFNRRAGGVKSFTNVARGWAITDGFVTDNHNLGIRVRDLNRALVGWRYKSPEAGRHQALIDVYLHDRSDPSNDQDPALNIQILPSFFDNTGYLNDTSNIGAGANDGTFGNYTIGTRWIGDVRYQGYVGVRLNSNGGIQGWAHVDYNLGAGHRLFHVRPIGFRNGASRKNATYDVKGIIKWAESHSGLADRDWYLTGVQAGFELIDTTTGFNNQGGFEFETFNYWTDIR